MLGRLHQRQRSSRADTQRDLGMLPCCLCNGCRIIIQTVVHIHSGCLLLQFPEMLRCADRPNIFQRIVYRFATQNSNFLVNFRIPHMQPHQKAVQLGFRQGLRSHTAQRILRSDDQMGLWQGIGLSLDRNISFFHRLQQRRLRLAGSPVDLVRQ